jgi:hypothetical protein
MRPLSGDARPLKEVALIAIETRCRNVSGRSLSCVPKGTGRRRRTTFGIWTRAVAFDNIRQFVQFLRK